MKKLKKIVLTRRFQFMKTGEFATYFLLKKNLDVGCGVMTEGHEYATEEQIYEKLKKTCGYS